MPHEHPEFDDRDRRVGGSTSGGRAVTEPCPVCGASGDQMCLTRGEGTPVDDHKARGTGGRVTMFHPWDEPEDKP